MDSEMQTCSSKYAHHLLPFFRLNQRPAALRSAAVGRRIGTLTGVSASATPTVTPAYAYAPPPPPPVLQFVQRTQSEEVSLFLQCFWRFSTFLVIFILPSFIVVTTIFHRGFSTRYPH